MLPAELIHPDAFLRPIIHMAPFAGKLNYRPLQGKPDIVPDFAKALADDAKDAVLTRNGREALNMALTATVQSSSDIVAIITPSNCGYVSSCVTKEIEKFCQWHFGVHESASIVVLVHEFGRFVSLPDIYRGSAIPVIEDCAYALVDRKFSNLYGVQGDYIVYSLSKALPLQYGGLLVARSAARLKNTQSALSKEGADFLAAQLQQFQVGLQGMNARRRIVYMKMQEKAHQCGFSELMQANEEELAQAFLVVCGKEYDAEKIKAHMNGQGIESSVFYGGGGYFLPCHQDMNDAEIDYIFTHLRIAFDNNRVL